MNNIYKKFMIYGPKKFITFCVEELKRVIIMQLIRQSYSQKGEDLIIDKLLDFKKNGFYIDIGANDPDRFSNTKRFYKRGWRGINIEPNKANFLKFVNKRRGDVNLNLGVGQRKAKMIFYKFTPDTLSTFSQTEAKNYVKQGYILEKKQQIEVTTLKDINQTYCLGKKVDFISIDTEGMDEEVLRGNDWLKLRSKLICIETIRHGLNDKDNKKNQTEAFLSKVGYKLVHDNNLNSIYQIR